MTAAGAARAAPLALVALAKALTSTIVLGAGFRALSDDDFARVVIAQRFVEAPSLDPSGTSWLPLPFWIYGGVMSLFGPTLSVARGTAFVLGLLSALLVYGAARLVTSNPRTAFWAALLACVIPWNAYLGVATVPEALTAALCLVGAASLATSDPKARLLGAAALAGACASRYEPWAVAAVFAALSLCDAIRQRSPKLAIAAGLAAAFPALWLGHGAMNHGDATFFVQRVSAYQQAVGGGPDSLFGKLSRFPLALVAAEPEIVALAFVPVLVAFGRRTASELARFQRPALALGALVLLLVAGDVRGGAPTHHAARALLPIWLLGAVVAAELWPRVLGPLTRPRRLAVAGGMVGLACVLAALRPPLHRPGAERSAEIEIGEALLERAGGRVAIDTPDFGFYAVMAGLGQPSRALPIDDRDPRRPRPADAFASAAELSSRLTALRARWLVTTRAHASVASELGQVVRENEKFVLFQLAR